MTRNLIVIASRRCSSGGVAISIVASVSVSYRSHGLRGNGSWALRALNGNTRPGFGGAKTLPQHLNAPLGLDCPDLQPTIRCLALSG